MSEHELLTRLQAAEIELAAATRKLEAAGNMTLSELAERRDRVAAVELEMLRVKADFSRRHIPIPTKCGAYN